MAKRVKLYEYRGATSIFIDAEIDGDGDVVVSGQDIGEAPEKFYGDSDYEYWVHVKAVEKPALLKALRDEAARRRVRPRKLSAKLGMLGADGEILTLIELLFSGDAKAFSAFRDFIDGRGIESEFGSWA